MKKTFLISTLFFYSFAHAGASDCSDTAGGMLQTLWMTSAVKSLKMQNVQFSPFLSGIDKIQRQKGGDQGKLKNLYQCTMISADPSEKSLGILAFLFTLRNSTPVENRLDLQDHIRLTQTIPAQNPNSYKPPAVSCWQVIYKVNGTQATHVGYLTVNTSTSWPEPVKSCNVLNDLDDNS